MYVCMRAYEGVCMQVCPCVCIARLLSFKQRQLSNPQPKANLIVKILATASDIVVAGALVAGDTHNVAWLQTVEAL